MYAGFLAACAVILVLLAWRMLTRPAPAAAGGPVPGDPFAAQIADFRRDLHNWDRG